MPFYLMGERLDLIAEHDELARSIAMQGVHPTCVVIDTLNRSMRGDENSADDMGRFIAACDCIRQRFDCFVLIVHHTGVDGSRPRGSTALSGACDCQLAIKRQESALTMTVEFLKDGDQGDVITSELETVEVGTDEDGDAITSCVLRPTTGQPQGDTGPTLTKNQKTLLNILQDAGSHGLTTAEVIGQANAAGIGLNRKADLFDNRRSLKNKGLIHEYAERWYATR